MNSPFSKLVISKYLIENELDILLNIDLKKYGNVEKKIEHSIYGSVDPSNTIPYVPELDDLTRLHFLANTRKAITILEFGTGYSTIVLADALYKNKQKYQQHVSDNLRCSNPFELHCVDADKDFLKISEERIPEHLKEIVHFHHSNVVMGKFNDRICTYYEKIPNIRPDLIYLDGPDQFIAKGSIHGVTTAHPDRMVMSADLLTIEHFLQPGTFILVDGRTANSRFLKSNFQRDWSYKEDRINDINMFELTEPPLGVINKKHLEFCFGENFNT